MKGWQEKVNTINQIEIQTKKKQLQHKHIHELITVFHFYFFPSSPWVYTVLILKMQYCRGKKKKADLI